MIAGLVGPTCVGKTNVSIALAKALSAEIVSVDSRQIYRELSIGTAKPSDDQLAAVPHHFIGERSIGEPVTAAEFASEARLRSAQIQSRGKHALLVGGSTLYLHALLFGLNDMPPSDRQVRERLQDRLKSVGLASLTADLAEKDPISYQRIDLDNPRRVLRALEVFEISGRPLSAFQTAQAHDYVQARIVVLNRARADLYSRIDRRASEMIEQGLVEEVKGILDTGLGSDLQALQTIGYREVIQCLAGEVEEDAMADLIRRNTRRYAKRQLTWFRRYEGFHWIEIGQAEGVESATSKVLSVIAPGAF
ncbi:MAG TPA: tRNA (adenosine(37)-N6)-dimethylallyltransferase MiaA [Rhodothermales bacterium]|nr:tRNA (adenosine(37)-N6)-dimethylallyltransferase MiaA [Rhodothermales bacterium]